ncbi:hypothetical protein CJF42_24340 [Pseudoalteromonas sp. NBT06-2]|nr:hypothetical protein CJF42_24340 [Pseudoalteromonas sp. NBT06-2]
MHQYIKLNGIPPAHTDFQNYFKVTPPTVNQMIKMLEKKELIEKQPRTARSIKLKVPGQLLPLLK